MLIHLSYLVVGMAIVLVWQFVRDRGHALYAVKDECAQSVLADVVERYTALSALNMINSGPTHQQVMSGGTVFAWFDRTPDVDALPKNARSYVVWGAKRRRRAAMELSSNLRRMGFNAKIHEPLPGFPRDTFLMVTSDAFVDSAHAFRPHWVKMAVLDALAKRRTSQ